ncbi:MAG: tRNA 5-methoxyuridine(34)/uridine 5-oxyacetic acid(34) synthase CmoB [Desulfobacula sp.]|uniref:tRNA 5-methoxyuridine(34)/uridine 5-oxyacetic acid(34) synthase CmoB n=1 Tax=Desulfobacula sp. TaxID=2593537 RepID=UPI0025BA04C5|nr:tRNA 5-methoxyuridine(34)/uridine 5-oxyacetic acid(34) synthase CmoB [Desulfobacula sp.]MCD4719475.1 tRNA 5-methoxyuridine(34)/uridine 5-oxyacetic acid(34) synthase CmoB [Desulfobacula sp.]
MEKILQQCHHLKIDHYYNEFEVLIKGKRAFLDHARGNFLKFKKILESIPEFLPSFIELEGRAVTIGDKSDLTQKEYLLLRDKLEQLCPWRKGPFNLFGIEIDSEWQSWIKWERLENHIGNLKGRRILDIGSSNGYYMFKMAACNPLMVLGVEPQSSFYFQYLTLQKFLNQDNVFCLPIPHDQLPKMNQYFDTVFCMGVLYHRKSPVQMLKNICDSMRSGGELILENLVINLKQNICLFPKNRYAKMRNVFFIPDLLAMESWLLRAGFTNIRCVDVTKTSFQEQRKTQWIHTETLKDFLDPNDPDKTVEGYPAPVRAIFIARAT